MSLNGLHDIGKEPFTFSDESILPHFVRDQTDEISRKENLLDSSGVGETRGGNLQPTDKPI